MKRQLKLKEAIRRGPDPYKKRMSHTRCPGTEKRSGEARAKGCPLHAKKMAIGESQTC